MRRIVEARSRFCPTLVHGVHHDGRRRENDVRLRLFTYIAEEVDELRVGQQHAKLLVSLMHKFLAVSKVEHLADGFLVEQRFNGARRHARLPCARRCGNEKPSHASMHVLAYTPDGFLLIGAVHNVFSKVWMSVRIVKAAEVQAPLQTDARKASMNRTQCAARLIQIAVSSLAQEKNIGTLAVLLFHERRPFLRLSDAVFCGMLRRLDRHDGQRFLLGIGEEEVDCRRLFSRALDLRVHEEVLTQSPSRLRTVHQDVAAARLGEKVGRHLDDAAVPVFFPQGGKLLRSLAVLLAPR